MFFLSIPYAWHLAGTWSEQLPDNSNLIGMDNSALIMTLHSIFIPLLLVICFYIYKQVITKKAPKVRS